MSELKYKSGGFSAIELIVMIVVLAITLTAFASSFNTITQVNKKSQNMNTASNLAYSKLQEYQAKPFDQIGGESASGEFVVVEDFANAFPSTFNAPKTATVQVSNPSSDYKQVLVNVVYGKGDNLRKVTYSDFIRKSN